MGFYQVVQPCAFVADGRAVHYTRPGMVVEVADRLAAPLVDSGKLSALTDLETRRREAITHHKAGVKRAALIEYRCRLRKKCLLLRVWQTPSGLEFYAPCRHTSGLYLSFQSLIDVRGDSRRFGIPDVWAGRLDDHLPDQWVPLVCDHHRGGTLVSDIRQNIAGRTPGDPLVVLVPGADTPNSGDDC